MATSDAWLRELADEDPPLRPYRAKVFRREHLKWNLPGLVMLYKALRRDATGLWDREAVVALYPLDAIPGTLPVALVPVPPDAVEEDDLGAIVVRGTVGPGRGLMLETNGRVVRPIGPATVPIVLRAQYRLK